MNKTIGIIGGGQLARMLVIAAKKLHFSTIILDPTPHSPAGQVADGQIVGEYKDEKATRELARVSDVITVDAEFVNTDVLLELEKEGKQIHPSPRIVAIIKDKLRQKEFLQDAGIPVGEFHNDVLEAAKNFGYPFLLKSRTDAYDGKGNVLITTEKDIDAGIEKLHARALYGEKFVPFVKELAVMVARSITGEIVCYPVVETTHKDNICHTVVAPAPVSDEVMHHAKNVAVHVAEYLEGAGVFGVEMFLTRDNKIMVNEIAPRVHNSGHYTIEACQTSQFEQHIRAITGMPFGSTEMVVPAAAMVNILGERTGKAESTGEKKAKEIAGVEIHIYGKMETRIQRKMGHVTAVGENVEEALQKAEMAREYIRI